MGNKPLISFAHSGADTSTRGNVESSEKLRPLSRVLCVVNDRHPDIRNRINQSFLCTFVTCGLAASAAFNLSLSCTITERLLSIRCEDRIGPLEPSV